MKKFLFFILFSIFLCSLSIAQSAEIITDILSQKKAQWDSLTYLAYYLDEDNSASDIILTPEETYEYFKNNGFLPFYAAPGKSIKMDETALFLSKVYNLPKTSALFMVFDSKRYAFRQFQHYNLYSSTDFPTDTMTGSTFVTLMGDFLTKFPDAKLVR